MLVSPYSELLADVFGAIVHPNGARLAPPFDDPVEVRGGSENDLGDRFPDDWYHALGGQREVNLDAKPLSAEVVQHVQKSKSPAVAEAICH